MADFRAKSVTVQACQFTGENYGEIDAFIASLNDQAAASRVYRSMMPGSALLVLTMKGERTVERLDWLVYGTRGELYPVKPDVFADKYETVAMIRVPQHVIVFAPETKPNMHHPEGCDVGACRFTEASMRIPLAMAAMHGSWTSDVQDGALVLLRRVELA